MIRGTSVIVTKSLPGHGPLGRSSQGLNIVGRFSAPKSSKSNHWFGFIKREIAQTEWGHPSLLRSLLNYGPFVATWHVEKWKKYLALTKKKEFVIINEADPLIKIVVQRFEEATKPRK